MTREEAIKEIKSWAIPSEEGREVLETLIPELRENEDERIRKAIIHYILYETKGTISEATEHTWVEWLEKQKEQKKSLSERFRPDFPTVADFIEGVDNMEKNKAIEILEDYLKWAVSSEEECKYTWKELADAIQLGIDAMKEQKPTWSEEDEKMRSNILNALTPNLVYTPGSGTRTGTSTYKYDKEIAWLKSLRPQPPVEWTEEDRRMLRACIEAVGSMSIRGDVQDLRDWLKSLCPDCCNRPKPAGGWRPSEEQMNVMKEAVMYFGDSWISSKHKILLGLYEQLKKLM